MFGFVTASFKELSKEQKTRYSAVYCGICRAIADHSGQLARMNLSYDMTFILMLLNSLYEPEISHSTGRCITHPFEKHEIRRSFFSDSCLRYLYLVIPDASSNM